MLPAALFLASMPHKPDIRSVDFGTSIVEVGGIWMVDGRAGDEGALIASAAWLDGGQRKVWVVRASQWLSASDFMGRGYRLVTPDPASARALLDRMGVEGVISIAERRRYAYPHSPILYRATLLGGFSPLPVPLPLGDGTAYRAIRLIEAVPDPAYLEGNLGSQNLSRMGGATP
jgi:hypothetical protein